MTARRGAAYRDRMSDSPPRSSAPPSPLDDVLDPLPPEFDRPMTAVEFLDLREQLPEQGQWAELVDGRVRLWPAPEVEHGDIVGNLMRLTTAAVALNPAAGMPLFRKPVQPRPRSVQTPAMVWLTDGGFAAMDAAALTSPPAWLVEIAGHPKLRVELPDRMRAYLAWGVSMLWVIDPIAGQIVQMTADDATIYESDETIAADPVVGTLQVRVAELFREPELWTRPAVVDDSDSEPTVSPD